jgi:hypothetical protein
MMTHTIAIPVVAMSMVLLATPAPDTWDLTPAALAAFDRYARLTEARMDGEIAGKSPYLWIDRQPAAQKADLARRLQQGEVLVSKLETRDGGKEIDTPDSMMHHWIGTVLLPGVKIERAIAFVQDYERYPAIFHPMILRAKILNRAGNTFNVQMRTAAKKLITVTLDGDYAIEYRTLTPARTFTRSTAANFYEISSPGTSSESRTHADKGNGFLWRLNTYCSFEQRSEGTYEQCESISLTRGIPYLMGPLVRPFVSSIPRETLAQTLGAVRAGLKAQGSGLSVKAVR